MAQLIPKEHDFNYDRLEGFMCNQLDEVREQLSKEVDLKLADLRAPSSSGV
jgi:hypothetical protein